MMKNKQTKKKAKTFSAKTILKSQNVFKKPTMTDVTTRDSCEQRSSLGLGKSHTSAGISPKGFICPGKTWKETQVSVY